MKPLKAYADSCRSASKEEFAVAHDHPFLVYSVVRGGDLKPAEVSSGLTLDRLVLEDEVREVVGGSPEDWYVVFEVVAGDGSGRRASIGCADDSDVQLNDASVSRRHATVERRDDGYFIVDEDSSAGTALNGRLLEPGSPARLEAGCRIGLGNVDVVFQLPEELHTFVLLVCGS